MRVPRVRIRDSTLPLVVVIVALVLAVMVLTIRQGRLSKEFDHRYSVMVNGLENKLLDQQKQTRAAVQRWMQEQSARSALQKELDAMVKRSHPPGSESRPAPMPSP